MEPDGEALSPESTITTLMSNSGHLRSSLVPEVNDSIRYNHKEYDSASDVLNAYIADFEWSRQNEEMFSGSLVLPESLTPKRPHGRPSRRQDVLKERLTPAELDFLNLPVSSLHHRSNRERLSMTTDELLDIPLDGSMPVTHTSAFIQGLSRSRVRHTSSLRVEDGSRCTRAAHGSSLSFTSPQKLWVSELDSSDPPLTPDRGLPAWLHPRQLESHLLDPLGSSRSSSRTSRTWKEEGSSGLVENDETRAMAEHQNTLKDLRLSLAEQIYQLAAEKNGSSVKEHLVREKKLERLIDKADQVLNTLSHSSGFEEASLDPGRVVDTMEAPGGSTAAPALVSSGLHTHLERVGPEQPGPLEALKQMMFGLQAVEAELERQSRMTSGMKKRREPETRWTEGPSLHSTLLSREKLQEVEDNRGSEEKDEGHCSIVSDD